MYFFIQKLSRTQAIICIQCCQMLHFSAIHAVAFNALSRYLCIAYVLYLYSKMRDLVLDQFLVQMIRSLEVGSSRREAKLLSVKGG